jgi:hypothetical protein
MATRRAEVAALAARAKKAGWDVTSARGAGGGYRIVAKNGWTTVLHATGELHATDQAVRNFEQYGNLLVDEKAAEKKAAREKAAKAAADAKANAEKTKQAAARSALVATAAGPYAGPEDVPLEWFLAEHPAPWMRWVIITPEIAAALLKRNIDNRPLIPAVEDNYRRVISSGHWRLTHQGGAMDRRGVLQDGQHRLHACVDTGVPIAMPFFVGMDPDNFKAIDEGKNRTIAHLLGKDGEIDVNLLGTTVRMIAASREPFPHAYLKLKTPNQVLYDSFKGDSERLRQCVRWGHRQAAQSRVVASALCAAQYLLLEANGQNNDYVAAFLRGLISGTKGDSRVLLDADDPRLALRDQLQLRRERHHRTKAIDQLAMVIWAWNSIVNGRRFRYAKWTEIEGSVAPITICHDRGRQASAAPELLRGEFTKDEK